MSYCHVLEILPLKPLYSNRSCNRFSDIECFTGFHNPCEVVVFHTTRQ